MQGSFKPIRQSNNIGDGNSLIMSNIESNPVPEEGLDYQDDNVLDFAKGANTNHSSGRYRKHLSTVVDSDHTSSKKSRKSISVSMSQQKACCDGGCSIF
jgi:hypothetical protein